MSTSSLSHRQDGRIGEYDLLVPIGTGGMGTVHLAQREIVRGVTREFALKLLHPHFRAEEGLAEQLMHEARLAARVQHPNVVQVIEAGATDAAVYLVMEYVEGETLAGLIRAAIQRGEAMSLPLVARIVSDALTGLQAAHEARNDDGTLAGIVHRDFTPQNLLVGADGRTRLGDFGIAKALDRASATATGIIKGKVSYMAPEQALGGVVGPSCDVWAAGVVLWEALACRRLFRGANDAETLLQVVSGAPPPRVSSVRPDATMEIDETIAAALRADPRARIADARELRQRVEAAWREHGIAEAEEVARFVGRMVGTRLRERREEVAEVLALRAKSVGAGAAGDGRGGANASEGALPRNARRSRLGIGASLVAILLGGGALATFWRSNEETVVEPVPAVGSVPGEEEERTELQPASDPRTSAGMEPEEHRARAAQASDDGTLAAGGAGGQGSARIEAHASHVLRLTANAQVVQLHLGARSIVVPDPVTELEVPLSEGECDEPLVITAVARGGRRATARVKAGQRAVSLAFGPLAGVPAAPRRPDAARSRDGLVASPYGSR